MPNHHKTSASDQHGFGITFEGITKRYSGKAVLENVTLTIEPGEFVTILGPSGSGKTTLLMLIAGFAAADEGRLMLGDEEISTVPPHRRNIGVVFQSYALFPHMNVRRNVAYPLRVRGTGRADQDRRTDWALSRVDMQAYAERRVNQLSGGQQQRVALARAIVFEPRALLMDEPLAALDKNLRASMQREIRSLQRSLGQTVVFVTHDQEEALNMSDRVAVMNDGRLQQVAAPRELYLAPKNSFVAKFFGESNLFSGPASNGRLKVSGVSLPTPERVEGPAVICVRPEAIKFETHVAPEWAIAGLVTESRFLGSQMRIEMETALGQIIVTRQIDGTTRLPDTGTAMKVFWDPAMSHVMAQ